MVAEVETVFGDEHCEAEVGCLSQVAVGVHCRLAHEGDHGVPHDVGEVGHVDVVDDVRYHEHGHFLLGQEGLGLEALADEVVEGGLDEHESTGLLDGEDASEQLTHRQDEVVLHHLQHLFVFLLVQFV